MKACPKSPDQSFPEKVNFRHGGRAMSTDSQPEPQATPVGLPAPKWCFVLLGVPTFYMPLAYLLMLGWMVFKFATGNMAGDPPSALRDALRVALYVTFVMLPIYLAWVALSKRLTRWEKASWLLMVIFINMLGMPAFYIFMIRRYLGLEKPTTQRDEAALERFLQKHAIDRDCLSEEQLNLLLVYCRDCRLAKLSIAFAAVWLCIAVSFPMKILPQFTNVICTVDTTIESGALHSAVEIAMLLGALAGLWATLSILTLIAALCPWHGPHHRKTLIGFLQATQRNQQTNPPA
jgi:hypothetical protein